MCFHCKAGNPQHHIPKEVRIVLNGVCTDCNSKLTAEQAFGRSPHWCFGRYILIGEDKPKAGYHKSAIVRGKFGDLSKIKEEVAELSDAADQDSIIMIGCELSDLYGAIRAYARNKGLSMGDLEKMADITKRAFESGTRRPRD